MAVPVKTTPRFDHGLPQALFTARIRNDQGYSVSNDGQRFLVSPAPRGPTAPAPPITVVINWMAALTAR